MSQLGWHYSHAPVLDATPAAHARLMLSPWTLHALREHFPGAADSDDKQAAESICRLLQYHFRHRLSEHTSSATTSKTVAWFGIDGGSENKRAVFALLINTQLTTKEDFRNPVLLLCTPRLDFGNDQPQRFGSRVVAGADLREPHKMRRHLAEALRHLAENAKKHQRPVHGSVGLLLRRLRANSAKAAEQRHGGGGDSDDDATLLQLYCKALKDDQATLGGQPPCKMQLPPPTDSSGSFDPRLDVQDAGFLQHMLEALHRANKLGTASLDDHCKVRISFECVVAHTWGGSRGIALVDG